MRSLFQSFRAVLSGGRHCQPPGNSIIQPEWVPSILRKSRAFPMAALCFALIAVLEIIYRTMEKSHGIGSDNTALVILIRYLPTAAAVVLGITWKSIVWDIKIIMPWSILSRDSWAQPSESIFLNYIHQIEILAAFTAAKKKHWAMLLSILTGFLCGTAVAAANSLTYVDLFAEVKKPVELQKTSRFDFNETLVEPNGTLKIPTNHLGSPPYAAAAVERLPGGHSASWSNQNYAFDSFAPTYQAPISANTSIEAHVNSFSANMVCHQLRVAYKKITKGSNRPFLLEANQEDLSLAGCSAPVSWMIKSCYHHPQAWLNITRCSFKSNDWRILAFVAIPEKLNSSNTCKDIQTEVDENREYDGDISVLSTAALLCNTKFSTQEAFLRVNFSTEETLYYEPTSPAEPVNVYPSTESVLRYLLNPTDSLIPEPYSQDLGSILWWISSFWGVDPFFSALEVGKNSTVERKWIDNSTLFESEVSAFASATLAQIVSVFSRTNGSETIHGFITSTSSRLLIRGFSLRLSQGILLTVGLAFVLLATVLRPRTHLKENPGPIAAVAAALAVSETEVERIVSGHFTASDETTQQALSSTQWRFCEAAGTAHLEVKAEVEDNDLPTTSQLGKHTGWRPVPFRALAKAGIITAFLAVIVSLAVLQQQSEIHYGLCRELGLALTVFQYSTSAILILLSYICSGIDSAVRSAISYYSLKNHPLSKRPLMFNIKDRPSLRLLWNAKDSMFAIAISSIIILILPIVKILSAGLFYPDLATTNSTFEFAIDQNLMTHLENTYTAYYNDAYYMIDHGYQASTSDTMVGRGRAAQYAQWSKTPGLSASQRDGIVENLVFPNGSAWFTALDQVSTIGDEVHATVPAIAVNPRCDMLSSEDFQLKSDGGSMDCSGGTFNCSTSNCNIRGDIPSPRMSGYFSLNGSNCNDDFRYRGDAYFGLDRYQVTIVDWSPWLEPVFNNTPIPEEGSEILPNIFNTSLPSI